MNKILPTAALLSAALTVPALLYGALIVGIVGFCFWKPKFPNQLAKRLRIKSARGVQVFLVLYWISIPVIIHRLMSMIWQS